MPSPREAISTAADFAKKEFVEHPFMTPAALIGAGLILKSLDVPLERAEHAVHDFIHDQIEGVREHFRQRRVARIAESVQETYLLDTSQMELCDA